MMASSSGGGSVGDGSGGGDDDRGQALIHLGTGFLSQCTNLTTIVGLSGALQHITTIPDRFLEECGFESIDLSGLEHITEIGTLFLGRCEALETIDLSVVKIDDCFLRGCSSLQTLDISPLAANLKTVGLHFATECDRLENEVGECWCVQQSTTSYRYPFKVF